jgi:hypothetical protein
MMRMCACVCVCMFAYVCICVQMHACVYICMCLCVCACIASQNRFLLCTGMDIYMYTFAFLECCAPCWPNSDSESEHSLVTQNQNTA